MIHAIKLCDLCHAKMDIPHAGVEFMFGQSPNGWGFRTTGAHFSGEVCEVCYKEFKILESAAQMWREKRRGVRMPNIVVTDRDVSFAGTDAPKTTEPKRIKQ